MLRYVLFLLLPALATAQPAQLHAHNDYEKPRPLYDAVAARADFIEADVWLKNGQLVVAHTPKELDTARRTLEQLYILPITRLFAENNGRPSRARDYTFSLMLDLKSPADSVIPRLITLLEPHLALFNRAMNPLAVRIVLSGNRPKPERYLDYPPYIFFDGRPAELYDEETRTRVAVVSDNFFGYSRWNGEGTLPDADREKLKRIIKRVHNDKLPIRFWGIPDQPNAWKQLRKLGVDVVNTDKIQECRNFF